MKFVHPREDVKVGLGLEEYRICHQPAPPQLYKEAEAPLQGNLVEPTEWIGRVTLLFKALEHNIGKRLKNSLTKGEAAAKSQPRPRSSSPVSDRESKIPKREGPKAIPQNWLKCTLFGLQRARNVLLKARKLEKELEGMEAEYAEGPTEEQKFLIECHTEIEAYIWYFDKFIKRDVVEECSEG